MPPGSSISVGSDRFPLLRGINVCGRERGVGSWSPQSGPGPPPPKSFCPLSACKPHSRQSQGCAGHPGSVVWGRALGLGVLAPLQVLGGEPGAPGAAFWVGSGARGPSAQQQEGGPGPAGFGGALLCPPCVTSAMFPKCSVTLQRAPPGCTPIWDHPDLSSLPAAASAPGGCRDGGVPP